MQEVRRLIDDGYPKSRLYAEAFAANGDFAEALAWTDSTEASGRALAAAWDRAATYALMGRRDDALAIVRHLETEEIPEGDLDAHYRTMARVWARLGDHDLAFQWLDRIEPPEPRYQLVVDSALDPLRDDPRYDALIAKHGLERVAANYAESGG